MWGCPDRRMGGSRESNRAAVHKVAPRSQAAAPDDRVDVTHRSSASDNAEQRIIVWGANRGSGTVCHGDEGER